LEQRFNVVQMKSLGSQKWGIFVQIFCWTSRPCKYKKCLAWSIPM